ncbi:cyclic nucleotide-binding domain-containing protein [Thalassospiraceae bacterium LMO-SO8]|nr:cyclic nucleotide-binding domain-containing protein [Alphaproteobacteria bacterium LMO-S08]WND75589.1 cyclic nucleotide-binding domain-containing protein [Thalassospiraceae bacterium LMO-SO8]
MSVTGVLERKMYQAGDRIFKEGDEGLFAYLVQSGSVEIYREGSGEVLSTIGAGGIFGEMALIDGKPRAASARSAGGCTVVVINRANFQHRMKKSDPFVQGLLKILAETVRRMSK